MANIAKIDRVEIRRRIREYSKGNERCSWFLEDELIDIGLEAEELAARKGSNFIHEFDQLIFEKSFEKGCPNRG